jgi:hypothetical protein
MTSPVISSSTIGCPSSSMSQCGRSSRSASPSKIPFTSSKSPWTAATSAASAGPATNCSGLIMPGLIGLVEFGTMCGMRFPAGRSYQGVEGSPCVAGITYGVDFIAFVAAPRASSPAVSLPSTWLPASAAFLTVSRSLLMYSLE